MLSLSGQLIMVVPFAGFVGGYTKELLGYDVLFLSGALAALVATGFTFLPSFLFLLAGGPFVESMRGGDRTRRHIRVAALEA